MHETSDKKIFGVIPAYNEEATIGEVVRGVLEHADGVIVVDDHSSDATGEKAAAAGAIVLRNEHNLGYDSAIDRGIREALASGADIFFTFDADGQHDPDDIPKMIAPILAGDADIVSGVRKNHAHAAEVVYALYTRLFGVRDPLCGFKAYAREMYEKFGPFDPLKSIGVEMLVRAIAGGARARFAPITIHARGDTSRFYKFRWRGNLRVLQAMLRVRKSMRGLRAEMPKAQPRILVIGAGSIGRRHIANLKHLGYAEIAFVESGDARLTEIEAEFSLPAYSSVEDGFSHHSPEIVLICTPADSHVALARTALEHGAHVFIEKPLAASLDGLDELEALAERSGRIVMVACNFRYHLFFEQLKETLLRGIYGAPLAVDIGYGYELAHARAHANYRDIYAAKRSLGGGVVFDSGAHVVDYLSALFGTPEFVHSSLTKQSDLEIETEDSAQFDLSFSSDCKAHVELDYYSVPSRHRIEVFFEQGSCVWDLIENTVTRNRGGVSETESLYDESIPVADRINTMYMEEIKAFMRAALQHGHVPQDIHSARVTLETLMEIRDKATSEPVPSHARSSPRGTLGSL